MVSYLSCCRVFDRESYSSGTKQVLLMGRAETPRRRQTSLRGGPWVSRACWKSTLSAYNLHNVHKIRRIILTIREPWQIYRPVTDMAAGFGSCCNLCDSATAKGCGGFFLQGIVLCTGDFLQKSRNPTSGESALSRHFIGLFLAVSVEISGFPVQLFL